MSTTPSTMMSMVTIDETAMEMVEMTSASSVPFSTPACSMQLSAQGTFRFERLPVTNPR